MIGRKGLFVNYLLAFILFAFLLCGAASPLMAEAVVIAPEDSKELITQDFVTYKGSSQYNGTTVASHISADDFASLEITDNGGTHTDGEGASVFSNYVIFKINLLFDSSSKRIGDTSVRVAKDSCDWNDMDKANNYKYGDPKTDTEQYIAYGAVSAVRVNGDGSVTKYTPMFSKGNTAISEQIFNIDGNYTIYVFFQTIKGLEIQKHILSWSFKVRTKVFLLDEETKYVIKDSGISKRNVVIDYANRDETLSQIQQKVQVNCMKDGYRKIDIADGFVLEAEMGTSSKYAFEVVANGFVAERFEFVVDTTNLQEQLLFGNLRKQTAIFRYEAEEYFYMTWAESPNNPLIVEVTFTDINASAEGPFFDGDGNPLNEIPTEKIDYKQGDRLDRVGSYYISAHSGTYTSEYWVDVVDGDNPSYNYSVLSAERFNNFKTKWYQVYDRINGRYLCFDMDEWRRAYDAAMTIENSTVNTATGRPYYNGKFYNDSIEVTAAMNEYVFSQNLKTIYYDPNDFSDSDESLRTFSSAAFDGTIYLNDEFQFVKQHGAEVETVVAINSDGRKFPIKFFTPISKQSIPHGQYTIVETDRYGHETRYTVYRDKKAPMVTVNANGEPVLANNGQKLSVNGMFAFVNLEDDFDEYAVLKVVTPSGEAKYYYQSEYKGISFGDKGEYAVSAYDRNNNLVEFTIVVV